MNYQSLFYWLVVADNAKTLFGWFIVIFMLFSIASTIVYLVTASNMHDSYSPSDKADALAGNNSARKWMWWAYPLATLFWMLYVLTPSKRDALLIVAGGQTMNFLTTDSSAKKLPSELSGFLVTEIKNMAAEVNVDLKSNDAKTRILEEAKQMTSDELIGKMKNDSTFAKVILNQ